MTKAGASPKYIQVAESLSSSIARGTWEPGERIPSLRALSDSFGVSVNTVREALAVLHDRGFVLPCERSGNYVLALPYETTEHGYVEDTIGHTLPGTSALLGDANLKARLDVSILPSDLVDRNALKRALAGAVDAHPELVSGYATVDRTLELRQFIAQRALQAGVQASPEEVVLTQGVLDGILKLLLMITRPGDSVAVESPTYYPILQMLRMLKRHAVYLPAQTDGTLHLEPLFQAPAESRISAILVTPSFQNPMGSSLTPESRQNLLAAARQIGAIIIEDDVHRETYAKDMPPAAIRSYDEGSHVLLCSSFSKIISPALRIGWILAGHRAHEIRATSRAVSCTVSGVSAAAATQLVSFGRFEKARRRIASALNEARCRALQVVSDSFPRGTHTYTTEGGLSLWIELPRSVDAMELYRNARREGIAIAPGPIFGPSESLRHALRLSPALFGPAAKDATVRVGELAQSLVRSRIGER